MIRMHGRRAYAGLMSMDRLDEQILARLMEDGRASFADIGAWIGLSAPAVKRRVDRLRQAGVITGFTAKVDPNELGWTTEAYVELYCQGNTSPKIIRDGMAAFPEVVSACTMTGDADALVHIRAADIQHFEEVLERINSEPYVVRTKSGLVLSRLLDRPGIVTHNE
jgi:DNA-binding Lrp family transcriptional regulator